MRKAKGGYKKKVSSPAAKLPTGLFFCLLERGAGEGGQKEGETELLGLLHFPARPCWARKMWVWVSVCLCLCVCVCKVCACVCVCVRKCVLFCPGLFLAFRTWDGGRRGGVESPSPGPPEYIH